MTVQVQRDGETRKTFDSGDPVRDQNDAFEWLLRAQPQSVHWATTYEGWEITEPLTTPQAAERNQP